MTELKRTCLVLGGGGFIGRNLVTRLVADGHRVRVFDRAAVTGSDFGPAAVASHVESVVGQLSDTGALRHAMQGVEVIFHLVSTTLPGRSNEAPVEDIESNLVAAVRLMDIVREHGGARIVFISSGGTVYGKPDIVPVPEDHPIRPICSYGICKYAIESYLHLYRHLYGLDYTVLRVSNPYGSFQRPDASQGVIPVFMAKLMRGEPIEIWGDGSVTRDFVYIDDVIDAMVLVTSADTPHRVFNIGSGSGTSLCELVTEISTVLDVEADIVYKEGRKLDVPVNTLDISRARNELGWEPATTLRRGLELTSGWLRSQVRS